MSSHIEKNVLLVGAGPMAIDYAKVLQSLGVGISVVGRGEKSAALFTEKTGLPVCIGGLECWIEKKHSTPELAIIAVTMEELAPVALRLMALGIKRILIEKPAGLNGDEVSLVTQKASETKTEVAVAYNRRFYASVEKATQIIQEDGGVTSFRFEFTEWSHRIATLQKHPEVFHHWFLGNSTHVVDLAFFLGGKPKEMQSYVSGQLSWHPAGSVFAGAGISDRGALFSYMANWEAPGRWGVEVLTKKHLLILKPLEKLQIQNIGSIETHFVTLEDELDQKFKPGLYKEVVAFLDHDSQKLCSLEEHHNNMSFYNKIANYRA